VASIAEEQGADGAATSRFWERGDIERRLHRVEGQVRGLAAMVQHDTGCAAVLTQVRAIRGALASIERIIETCSAVEKLEAELGPFDPVRVREALMTTPPPPPRA
jgi:DNA-binding FrmR family transcriptional regulator